MTATSQTRMDGRWFVLITVGIGTLLSSLNNSIVNTILPTIERDLRINLGESEWIVLIYLLILTLLLVPLGRLSDLVGRRFIFLLGFLLFMVASIVCGLSTTYALLVAGRALLAVAGAMILSVGPALITATFPRNQRGRALGLQALMTYLGLAVGPVVGGWLTDLVNWQFVFYSTVPVGILGIILGFWFIPRQPKSPHQRLDWVGTLLFIVAMTSIVLLLNAGVIHERKSILLPVLAVLFVVCTVAFLWQQRRSESPLIQLSLFRIRNFGFGTLGAILNYLCFFLALFLLPFYLSRIFHLAAAATGLWLALMPLVMMVSAPLAGAWSDAVGSRILSSLGMAANGVGLACFAAMSLVHPAAIVQIWLAVGLILSGLGTGLFAAPNNAAILKAAPASKQGMASGTLATARYIGMMSGITIGGSLFGALLTLFAHGDAQTPSVFLRAFAWAMWVGVGFSAIGVLCTLSMEKGQTA